MMTSSSVTVEGRGLGKAFGPIRAVDEVDLDLAAAGATLIVSSHVMDEADRCDELILMRQGRILAQGTAASLRARAGTPDLEAIFLRFAEERTEDDLVGGRP